MEVSLIQVKVVILISLISIICPVSSTEENVTTTTSTSVSSTEETISSACEFPDITKVPFVTVVDSEVSLHAHEPTGLFRLRGWTFSQLQFVCIGHYPIQWNFDKLPMNEASWNVSYIRVAKNVRDESSFSFEAILTFSNVSTQKLTEIRPVCELVADPNCYRCAVVVDQLAEISDMNNATFIFDSAPKNYSSKNTSEEECDSPLSLSFDMNEQLFYCKDNSTEPSNSTNSRPVVSFRKCSNPSDCGNPASLGGLCFEPNPSSDKCVNGSHCTESRMDSDVETPTVVTCDNGRHGVYLNFFHSTVDNSKRELPNLYFNWKDVEASDLIYLEFSRVHVIAQEPFDIICTSSYFYFAKGAHLTLKDLSDPLHLEIDLTSVHNISLFESVEVRKEPSQSGRISLKQEELVFPVKHTLIAQGMTFPAPGDYELTCYAPVWNSFQWTAKSLLISVQESGLPEFVNGNLTVNLKFHSLLNISCIAKGRPAPKVRWIISDEMFGAKAIEMDGNDEMVTWSFLTLPKGIDSARQIIKCRAENLVGYVEKVFVIERDDESNGLNSKIAAAIMLIGFLVNLIILYCCWKHLFSGADSMISKFCKIFEKRKESKCQSEVPCSDIPCCVQDGSCVITTDIDKTFDTHEKLETIEE